MRAARNTAIRRVPWCRRPRRRGRAEQADLEAEARLCRVGLIGVGGRFDEVLPEPGGSALMRWGREGAVG